MIWMASTLPKEATLESRGLSSAITSSSGGCSCNNCCCCCRRCCLGHSQSRSSTSSRCQCCKNAQCELELKRCCLRMHLPACDIMNEASAVAAAAATAPLVFFFNWLELGLVGLRYPVSEFYRCVPGCSHSTAGACCWSCCSLLLLLLLHLLLETALQPNLG